MLVLGLLPYDMALTVLSTPRLGRWGVYCDGGLDLYGGLRKFYRRRRKDSKKTPIRRLLRRC